MGFRYQLGEGVTQDYSQAAKWYRKSAEQNNSNAQYKLGFLYNMGFMGVPRDPSEAAKWYLKAAEQGQEVAQSNLAGMLQRGDGVAQDLENAAKWHLKAAEKGMSGSQFELGMMYASGQGVTRNLITAYAWFNISAADGKTEAITALETLQKSMSPDEVTQAQKMSREMHLRISTN
jgi:TPR repeat protein